MLNGKNILLTGGSRGIGAAIADLLASYGANIAFTYMSSAQKANDLAKELSDKYGTKVIAFQSDASSFEAAGKLVDDTINALGSIDVLINNAGITRDNLMLRMSEEQWDEVIQTNLKSVFNLTKHALKPMLKNKKGSIINLGSVVGVFGNAGQANYAASKAGVIGFSKSIAKEVGSRGIRCNVITPGYIETDMTDKLPEDVKKSFMDGIPLKRLGQASEVAELCAFLGSDNSRYITGQVISICGGMNM